MPLKLPTAALLATGVAVLAAAPAGAQSPDRAAVADGQTMLRLDRGTARALNAAGVKVDLLRPATSGRSGLTFPVTGGAIDPATLRGSVAHRGGLRFRAGRTRVELRDFVYRIGARRATLSAEVGGSRVAILALNLRRARVTSRGPLTKAASRIRATLTGDAARALNAAFSTRLFGRGLAIGTVRSEVVLGEAAFAGGATTLALDPGAAQALQSLQIAPGVVGDARAGDDGLAFPITGGKVDATTLAGTIAHSGGISLTRGATRVELTDFAIGIDDTPALSALVGGRRVEILTLDVANLRRSVRGRTVVVEGVVGRLTAAAAAALNDAFATDAFKEGLALGTASVRGRTR
jgi:hypothetical protein